MAKETCTCGAVYEVTYRNTLMASTQSIDCDHCGAELAAWHDQMNWPDYKLISRPLPGSPKLVA
jgi:hypothetical protein